MNRQWCRINNAGMTATCALFEYSGNLYGSQARVVAWVCRDAGYWRWSLAGEEARHGAKPTLSEAMAAASAAAEAAVEGTKA